MLSRLSHTQARAFSISLARSSDNIRKSPIVGDITDSYTPSAPKPRTRSSFSPLTPLPRPPPLPRASSAAESPSQAEPRDQQSPSSSFPYDATDQSSDAFSRLDLTGILTDKAAAYGQALGIGDPLTRPKVRTKAVTGRTVFIKERLTATSAPTPVVAIRVLERMCREQKVKNKYHSQKFHERKGLKKKRLRSQRWRARFKTGFKAAVSKVMELKKQGW